MVLEVQFMTPISDLSVISCAAPWCSFQEEKEEMIRQMNETGRRITLFSTAKAANSKEAEDKLQNYKVNMILFSKFRYVF